MPFRCRSRKDGSGGNGLTSRCHSGGSRSGESRRQADLVPVPPVAHHRGMRMTFILALLLLPAAAAAQPPGPPRPGGGVFLSPMGEPFRSPDPAADNVGAWFAAADGNSDGALSLAELQADAARFFGALDADGNGELGPAEIARYENEVAPEVQLGLQMRGTGFGGWRGPGSRRRRVETYDRGIEGAGRYTFLNIPQPVIAADM